MGSRFILRLHGALPFPYVVGGRPNPADLFADPDRQRVDVFASAGIAGVIVSMAARSTFASLIVELQVAITQPIRIDHALVVEGEWSWIGRNRIHLCRSAIVGSAASDRSAYPFY